MIERQQQQQWPPIDCHWRFEDTHWTHFGRRRSAQLANFSPIFQSVVAGALLGHKEPTLSCTESTCTELHWAAMAASKTHCLMVASHFFAQLLARDCLFPFAVCLWPLETIFWPFGDSPLAFWRQSSGQAARKTLALLQCARWPVFGASSLCRAGNTKGKRNH